MISMMTWLPECPELAGLKINKLTLDSREVSKGAMFIALKGFVQDGHDYIAHAIKNGASAILCEHEPPEAQHQVPVCIIENLRERLGALVHEFYGQPTHHLKLIGVTGTNGKTSTCQYIAQSLDYLGQRCGIIGTNGQGLWGQLRDTLNTTPDVVRLHGELARQREQGADFSAMEVSSHGLHQGRLDGVQFSTAVFTNLSQDHLDYHGTMENYGNAKWLLMQWPKLKNAIVNLDDPWVQQHLDTIAAEQVLTYGVDSDADVKITQWQAHEAGIDATVSTPFGQAELNLRLLGQFNLSNALAAFSVLLAEGIPLNTAARVVSNCNAVKGRMERLRLAYGPTVVIDYAHTPDALAKALQACRDHVSGRLGVVFGCGGDRDIGKRPEMAKAAEEYADFLVVTDDNPRSEPSENIIKDIVSGFSADAAYKVIANRADAISQTLSGCDSTDVVLIAGKGHERYQEIAGVRHAYSDHDSVMQWQEVNDVE